MRQPSTTRGPRSRLAIIGVAMWLNAFAPGARAANNTAPVYAVGFQRLVFVGDRSDRFEAAFWYPTGARPHIEPLELTLQNVALNAPVEGMHLPLIVISHGALGSLSGHVDTAAALAEAGFVVAAISHHEFGSDGRLELAARVRQLRSLITYAVHGWPESGHIDPRRIGAFGFSAGGFTVLAAAGGTPNPALIAPHCRSAPSEWSCVMSAARKLNQEIASPALEKEQAREPIDAAVIAAPALGYTFDGGGLDRVRIPVQLWQASDDTVLLEPWAAQAVRRDLPVSPEFHLVKGADHGDFTAPCAHPADSPVCKDISGFDRARFHLKFNSEIVRFFLKWLAAH